MPIVNVQIAVGRSAAQKNAMAQAVTQAVAETLGAPLDAIRVLISEVDAAHWYVGGTSKAATSIQPEAIRTS